MYIYAFIHIISLHYISSNHIKSSNNSSAYLDSETDRESLYFSDPHSATT